MSPAPTDLALFAACAIFAVCGLAAAEPIPWEQARQMAAPLPIAHATALVRDGAPVAVIGIPDGPVWPMVADSIADRVEQITGVRIPVVGAEGLVSGPAYVFGADVMRSPADGGRNLVLLGDLTSNRAIARLYEEWYAFEDAVFPGNGGWSVRTVVDPEGLGWNAVVLGGSGPEEVAQAAEAWLAGLQGGAGTAAADHRFEVRFGEHPMLTEITRRTAQAKAWPEAWRSYLERPDSEVYRAAHGAITPIGWASDVLTRFVFYGGMHYAVNGDPEFARMAGDGIDALYENLEWVEANRRASWDAHYMVEMWLRAWQQVANSPELTDRQRERGHAVMAFLADQTQLYTGMGAATPYRILSRHQYSGVFASDALCRWVQQHCRLSPELADLLAANRADFRPVIHEMMQTYTTGFDHKWGLDGNWHLLQMAVEEPVPEYIGSGLARMNADFATMCINNAGDFVNFGAENIGAIEGYDAWQIVGRAATITRDGRYQWWLDNRMERFPYKVFIMSMSWLGHWHATSLEPVEPTDMIGVNRALLPAPLYEDLLAGKGRLYAGTPVVNDVPLDRSFNKITFRDGLAADDSYLMLDGLGGVTYSGNDANAISEYSRFGTPLLVQYTLKHEPYYQNTCSVSRGNAGDPVGTFAQVDEMADLRPALYTKTTLSPLSGADHTRHLFMEKGGAVVVLDDVVVHEPDDYFITCNFRGFGKPTVDEAARTWLLDRGDAGLVLRSVRLPEFANTPELAPSVRTVTVTREGEEVNVQMLRETVAGTMQAGERYRFANAFVGVRDARSEGLQAVGLPGECVAVTEPETVIYAAPASGEVTIGGLRIEAAAVRLSRDAASFVALRSLAVGGEAAVALKAPVTLDLDLTGGTSRLLAPASRRTGTIAWEPEWSQEATVSELARGVILPGGGTVEIDLVALGRAVAAALQAAAQTEPAPPAPTPESELPMSVVGAEGAPIEPAPCEQAVRADITGDGRADLLLAREDGRLVAVAADGTPIFDRELSPGPLQGVWAGQVEGAPPILACGRDGVVHALDATGRTLWAYQNDHWGYGGSPVVYSVTVGDFRGDGSTQIALGCHGGVTLLDLADGPRFARFTEVYAHDITPIDAVRMPGENRDWVLLNSRGGGLKLVDPANGVVVNGWAQMWGGRAYYLQSRRIGDQLWFITAGFNGIGAARLQEEAWREGKRDTASLWADGWFRRTDGETRAALLTDVDGDGAPEILSGNETGFLVCYSLAGERLWSRLIGTPISDIIALPGGRIAVAGRRPGLTVFGGAWEELLCWSPEDGSGVTRLWADDGQIVALSGSGQMWRLTVSE